MEIGPVPDEPTPDMSVGGSETLNISPAELSRITAGTVSLGTFGSGWLVTPNLTVGYGGAISVPYGLDLWGEAVTVFPNGVQTTNKPIQFFSDDSLLKGPVNAGTGSITATSGLGVVRTEGSLTLTGSSFAANKLKLDGASGPLTLNAPGTVGVLEMSDGALAGSGSLALTGASSTWSGGIIGLDVTNSGTIGVGGYGGLYAVGGTTTTFTNSGTVNWTSGNLEYDGGFGEPNAGICRIDNQTGAIFDINGDVNANLADGGNASAVLILDNAGTVKKSNDSVTNLDLSLFNLGSGLVDVKMGTLEIGKDCLNNGTVKVAGGTTFAVDGAFYNNGLITGSGTIGLPGAGTLDSPGTIAPGGSAGILVIDGDLVLYDTSEIDIDIGGTTAGTQHDQIQVNGSLWYGGEGYGGGGFGTLNISEISPYTGNLGDTFTIIEASSGDADTFSTIHQTSSFDVADSYYDDPYKIILSVTALNNQPSPPPSPPPPPAPDPYNLWTLGRSGSWSVAGNWSYGTVPNGDTEVRIVDGLSTVTLSAGDYTIGSLLVGTGNTLALTGGSLTLLDASSVAQLMVNGGTMIATMR